jgi:hypothetical protein
VAVDGTGYETAGGPESIAAWSSGHNSLRNCIHLGATAFGSKSNGTAISLKYAAFGGSNRPVLVSSSPLATATIPRGSGPG